MQDCYTVVLEHVQESGLSGIVKAEEQQLCVLVGEAKRGQEIEDWRTCQRRVSTMNVYVLRLLLRLRLRSPWATWSLGSHTPVGD